eukprot:763555-Karenia_brevis.AAC.1
MRKLRRSKQSSVPTKTSKNGNGLHSTRSLKLPKRELHSLSMTECSLKHASTDHKVQLQKMRSKYMWMLTGAANQTQPWFVLMLLKTLRKAAFWMLSRNGFLTSTKLIGLHVDRLKGLPKTGPSSLCDLQACC